MSDFILIILMIASNTWVTNMHIDEVEDKIIQEIKDNK